ncbi:hypothetical protein DU474_03635 [Campylobacter novaezeelandiae]|uniref:hypothetical protein n=1 Tax=Campylobacter novaezeelandiae TaxID=2267891 RepID=UPI0010380765|nr:hypothetical protein [Campylobacter novaezeelandiae]QWU80240.1 hypothetical protein CNZW441b_0926 [Campylobacter novaezeelandiae]TBR79336.1 hypothetical protein DU474_03635 [Campylobacter novaezeelandiae]
MNFKIFSIIVGILITIIAILGGTYYYLFEYSKPKNYTLNSNSYSEQKSYSNNYNNSYSSSTSKIDNNSYNTNTNNNIIQKQETSSPNINQNSNNNASDIVSTSENNENNKSINDNITTNTTTINKNNENLNTDNNISNTITTNENNQSIKTTNKDSQQLQQDKQTKIEALKKEISKQQKILEREKAIKKELQSNKSNKNKYLNTAREYLSIGKNSRLEPELSTENMKVYILDGKFLSQYRINLLKDMLNSIKDNSKDYYLSVFVKMLPKGEMKLTIYNKEIIFSDMKKSYKYINLNQLSPYLNNLNELNQHVAREEIMERLKLQIKKEGKGSEFSKHIKSLKTGLNTAQYFFPFCEIIEISSI